LCKPSSSEQTEASCATDDEMMAGTRSEHASCGRHPHYDLARVHPTLEPAESKMVLSLQVEAAQGQAMEHTLIGAARHQAQQAMHPRGTLHHFGIERERMVSSAGCSKGRRPDAPLPKLHERTTFRRASRRDGNEVGGQAVEHSMRAARREGPNSHGKDRSTS
jgi:hypothetical protein